MLTVTLSAKDKLKEHLQIEKKDEETLLRISSSSSDPQQIRLLMKVKAFYC